MVFTSYQYLVFFLPLVVLLYFSIAGKGLKAVAGWIIIASLFFYGTWNPFYLLLLGGSILVNYSVGLWINRNESGTAMQKMRLAVGVVFNIALLGYFKYTNFFVNVLNDAFSLGWHVERIVLPLAVSFFTFQQIAWLMDQYRRNIVSCTFAEYVAAVAFFPHLIAGPIVRYADLLPQFQDDAIRQVNWENISRGIFCICLGTFKKIVLADTLAQYAGIGFDQGLKLTLIPAWESALAYSLQIYFDFSGYCDIAIGSALLMNIRLPANFHSPYKSLNIREFWRTWHITLGDFLTRYLYIPLGGSRCGTLRTYFNLFAVMFISGLWHGAGYGFILWGCAHGLAMVIHRAWAQAGMRMHWFLARTGTFVFVTLAWVFFRATDIPSAMRLYEGLFGLNGVALPEQFARILPSFLPFRYINAEAMLSFGGSVFTPAIIICLGLGIVFFGREVETIWDSFDKPKRRVPAFLGFASGLLVFIAFCKMIIIPHTEFIYFNF